MPRADEICLLSKTATNLKPIFLYSKQTNCTERNASVFIITVFFIRTSRLNISEILRIFLE